MNHSQAIDEENLELIKNEDDGSDINDSEADNCDNSKKYTVNCYLWRLLSKCCIYLNYIQSDIYFVVFSSFFISIIMGILFYSYWHDWEISTSFYYSSQVLLGNMYGIPEEIDHFSQAFTIIFFLWGCSLIAAIHLVATGQDHIVHHQQSRVINNNYTHTNSIPYSSRTCSYYYQYVHIIRYKYILPFIQSSYFTTLCSIIWVSLGTLFGIYYEGWSFLESLYFAVGAMSAAGIPSPNCINGDDQYPFASCQLGTVRGYAMGIYLIIGVPLFAFSIGHVAGYVIASINQSHRKKIYASYQQIIYPKLYKAGTLYTHNSNTYAHVVNASSLSYKLQQYNTDDYTSENTLDISPIDNTYTDIKSTNIHRQNNLNHLYDEKGTIYTSSLSHDLCRKRTISHSKLGSSSDIPNISPRLTSMTNSTSTLMNGTIYHNNTHNNTHTHTHTSLGHTTTSINDELKDGNIYQRNGHNHTCISHNIHIQQPPITSSTQNPMLISSSNINTSSDDNNIGHYSNNINAVTFHDYEIQLQHSETIHAFILRELLVLDKIHISDIESIYKTHFMNTSDIYSSTPH